MLRHKFYVPALAALLALGSTACQKDPETEPRYLIRDDLEWDAADRNATVALYFFNDLFNYLPTGFNRLGSDPGDFLATGTDDALPSRFNRPAQYFTNGAISVVNSPDQYWTTAYAGIRRVNIFLANIDKVPALPANIVIWKAETRFIRAMLYFELVKRYGGVPLVGDKLFTLDDDLSLPRSTYAQSVDYIVGECDAIKGDLRLATAIPDGEWGRIPRTAALALKARLLLYAASPLYNGGQVGGAGQLQGYPNYDAGRWQTALTASQDLITASSGVHGLLTTPAATAFASVFTVKKNTEIILGRQASNNTTLESYNAPVGYGAPTASQGLTSPSQNFVDAFPMLNGLAITASGSGYDATNPYANRDPRLLASVFANAVTTGTTTVGSRWLSRNVETFDGGRDRPGGSAVQTRTGYYLRKFLGDFTTSTSYSNQSHNFPLFRYAEVLLNTAEALNEVGRTTDALTTLVPLRQRAGLTAGTGSRYGIPTTLSQADARAFIQNERRIELGFEEHRFWDVRRWKTAENVLSGPLYGMQITKGGTTAAPTYTYNPRATAATMVWQTRLYYLPLPYDETTKNLNLTQNPGW